MRARLMTLVLIGVFALGVTLSGANATAQENSTASSQTGKASTTTAD